MEDIIREIKELEGRKGEPFLKSRIRNLRFKLIQESKVDELGKVEIGDWVLTWHPKIRSKKWPKGIMMIYTKESYGKAMNYYIP